MEDYFDIYKKDLAKTLINQWKKNQDNQTMENVLIWKSGMDFA